MASYPIASSSTPPPYASSSAVSAMHLGQTRSRTLLFLSYRDSAGPSTSRSRNHSSSGVNFETPYTDDDPLNSSSLAQNNDDTDALLPTTTRRSSREGHISLPISPSLPPKWMDISDQVDSILSSIRPRMETLSRLHEKHLRPGFADKSRQEKQIESLALEITKDFQRSSRLVSGLASYTQHLIRQSKQASGEVTVRQIALAQNVQTALASRVQDLSGAFRKQQSLYLKRMKGMQVRDRDIRAASGLNTTFKDSQLAVQEDIDLATSSNSNLLMLEEEQQIQQRTQEIDQIAKSIQELATLFSDLQSLVIDQGTLLDRIDYNVELMSTELKGAVHELETATRYQRRSGRRQCILFLCLLIALLVTVIIVKPFWRFFSSPSTSQEGQK